MKNHFLKRRGSLLVLLLLAVSLTFVALSLAAPAVVEDAGTPADVQIDGLIADDAAEDAEYSHRLIVELDAPSVVSRFAENDTLRTAEGRLNLRAPAVATYRAQLEAQQAEFVSRMATALPNASVAGYLNESGQRVAATYQLVMNAVAVDPGVDVQVARRQLAKMEDVKAVHLDYARDPDMYASLPLINADAVWSQAGGRADAGSGVKVASMDGGVHHEAPMFDGTGWSYPPGYPLGDTNNTNGKIIVSRAYFRDWDPPAPGDENTWPGENGTSHGTHTASTAAGNVIDGFEYAGTPITDTISGVAPGAWVMSYRVFYNSVTNDGSFYNVEGIAALEDIVADGADVVNNSWGGGPGSVGGEFDPLDNALIAASQAGVFVSMSNGNAGPGTGTGDHPSADYMNVAASTTSGTYGAGRIDISGPEPISPTLQDMPMGVADFGEILPAGNTYSYNYIPSVAVNPANFEGCGPWTGTPFDGAAALISRGSCSFGDKVYYAQEAGAEMVIIYNHATGGDEITNMTCGGSFCDPGLITIPSFFIGHSNGLGAIEWYDDNGSSSEVTIDYLGFWIGNDPDFIANFSSRGPGVGNVLKPDIAAPGVNIMAQGYTPGTTGEARHLGFGQVSGTSMAAPHVAGAAAVLREIHPSWSNGAIKSALMSTSQYMHIYNADGSPAQPLDMGAGRLDMTHAADPGVILDPPSLSFGQIITGTTETIMVQVTSVATATETYSLSTLYTGNGFAMTQTTSLPGFSVTPLSVTLAPGESAMVEVTFDTSQGMGLGENQGYIIMAGDNGHHAHMPAWGRVAAAPTGDVLLMDNDLSGIGLGFADYAGYYTSTLEALGVDYTYWDTAAYCCGTNTIPNAGVLAAYDAIVYFSGDNYYPDGTFTVPTPLTTSDMERLNEYAQAGGKIIAMGQDATWVLNDSFFGGAVLGAERVQDSITNFSLPQYPIIPADDAPPAFDDVVLDLGGPEYNYIPLEGSEEVPPVATTTSGEAIVSYDGVNNYLWYQIEITAGDPVTLTGAHVHSATVGTNGGVLFATWPFTMSQYVTDTLTWSGSQMLSDVEEEALLDGHLYINVHSEANPAGEVRGQLFIEASGDGAANQYYIDELETFPGASPNPVPGTIYPFEQLFAYPGSYDMEDGIVGLSHRDQPSLEWPGIDYLGRSIFTSFGLEGVNDGTQATSREELMGMFLDWAMDEPEVTIDSLEPVYSDTTDVAVFEANLTSNIMGTEGVSYRWDFGDGSGYTVPYDSNVVSHEYTYCGTYHVRVEAVDSWGNHTIGSAMLDVTEGCSAGWRTFMPLVTSN